MERASIIFQRTIEGTNQVYTMDIAKNWAVCYEWSIVPCNEDGCSSADKTGSIRKASPCERPRSIVLTKLNSKWNTVCNANQFGPIVHSSRRGLSRLGNIYISNRVVERPIQLSRLVESGESDFHAKHIEMEAETRSSTGKGFRLARLKK